MPNLTSPNATAQCRPHRDSPGLEESPLWLPGFHPVLPAPRIQLLQSQEGACKHRNQGCPSSAQNLKWLLLHREEKPKSPAGRQACSALSPSYPPFLLLSLLHSSHTGPWLSLPQGLCTFSTLWLIHSLPDIVTAPVVFAQMSASQSFSEDSI